jgi:hypothetical protein
MAVEDVLVFNAGNILVVTNVRSRRGAKVKDPGKRLVLDQRNSDNPYEHDISCPYLSQ